MLRLYLNHFDEVGQYLRLQVHDSLVTEVPKGLVDKVEEIMAMEMTRPVPELRMPTSYKLGELLSIDVEKKIGERWGSMS